MPELPDVEVLRQHFYHSSLNKKIINIKKIESSLLEGIDKKSFIDKLKGSNFTATARHGKYFFALTDKNIWLVLHFGMTGNFIYQRKKTEIPEHTRAYFEFSNSSISYICVRKLGMISLVSSKEEFINKKKLGPDAINISKKEFMKRIKNAKMIKSGLMDQKSIAGIGNIYADEILFQSKIHPKTKADKLDDRALEKLYENIQKVLKTAIDKKVNVDEFPSSWLIHKREENEKCPGKYKGRVKKTKVNNRSAYYCPSCQKKVV